MSFASQQAVCCLGNQFQYCLLIVCIKTKALNCQQLEDSESDATKPKELKRQYLDPDKNKEE